MEWDSPWPAGIQALLSSILKVANLIQIPWWGRQLWDKVLIRLLGLWEFSAFNQNFFPLNPPDLRLNAFSPAKPHKFPKRNKAIVKSGLASTLFGGDKSFADFFQQNADCSPLNPWKCTPVISDRKLQILLVFSHAKSSKWSFLLHVQIRAGRCLVFS